MSKKPIDGSDDDPDAESLYSDYVATRTDSELKVDNVMALLVEEGLVKRAAQINHGEESVKTAEEEFLHGVYDHYRESRNTVSDLKVDSVMAKLASEDEAEQPDHLAPAALSEEVMPKKTSTIGNVFRLPGQLLDRSLSWIKNSGGGILAPRVVLPVAAVAVLSLALAPLVTRELNTAPGGVSVAEYSAPEILLAPESGASGLISLDPGFEMGISPSSSSQKRAFDLGRRLLEVEILAATSPIESRIANVLAIKIKRIGDTYDTEDHKAAIDSLAQSLTQAPLSNEGIGVALANTVSTIRSDELTGWTDFGMASEAVNLASRMAEGGISAPLSVAIDRFNNLKFSETLDDVSAESAAIVGKLGEISGDAVSDPGIASRAKKLISQLYISVQ